MLKQISNIPFHGTASPNNLTTVPHVSTQSSEPTKDTFQKEGTSKKKKIGIIAGVTAAAIGVTAGILIAIKSHNKAKALKSIPEELKAIFKELENENGDDFVNKAYSKLKAHMNLEGIAPEKIDRQGPDKAFSITGGYSPSLNTIGYTDGFFDKLSKNQQLNFLSHELKHAEQASKIIRSGFIEDYAQAWAESNVANAAKDPMNFGFQMNMKAAENNGQLDEFMKATTNFYKDSILTDMKKGHERTLEMLKFEKGSSEYQEAQNYLKAAKNYEGIGFFGIGGANYKNNPLEVEAYSYGDKTEKMYQTYIKYS